MEVLLIGFVAFFCLLFLASFVGFIWLVVAAFRTSILWGLGVLLTPIGWILFAISDFDRAKRPLALWFSPHAVIFLMALILPGARNELLASLFGDDADGMGEHGIAGEPGGATPGAPADPPAAPADSAAAGEADPEKPKSAPAVLVRAAADAADAAGASAGLVDEVTGGNPTGTAEPPKATGAGAAAPPTTAGATDDPAAAPPPPPPPVIPEPLEVTKAFRGETFPYRIVAQPGWSVLSETEPVQLALGDAITVTVSAVDFSGSNKDFANACLARLQGETPGLSLAAQAFARLGGKPWAQLTLVREGDGPGPGTFTLYSHGGERGGYSLLVAGSRPAQEVAKDRIDRLLGTFRFPPDNFRPAGEKRATGITIDR